MSPEIPIRQDGLSVIVPTCNPREGLLSGLITALAEQTIPPQKWELIVVDNASKPPLSPIFESLITLGVRCQIIREERAGLTFARLAGFATAQRNLIVMLDDDNRPNPNFLARAESYACENPTIGTFGGRVIPRYDTPPPTWFPNTGLTLGCRDFGDTMEIARAGSSLTEYPKCSPIGAGMILRREVAELYSRHVTQQGETITDRQGEKLSSGGDCEIVLVGLFNGWDTAYVPELSIEHLIPASRLAPEYLARLNRESSRSWVLLLERFGLNPWPPIQRITVPLRKLKAWFFTRAWKGPQQHIMWSGLCGIFEGRSAISSPGKQ